MVMKKQCLECGALEDDPEVAFCALDGTRLVPIGADTMLGREVAGRYRIRSVLGEGGMGAVYRATQLGIDRDVALKIIRPELAQDPALQARFTREARLASRVQSIRVVTLFDYGRTDDDLMYMAMELLDGESLADRLAREGLVSAAESVRVGLEVARALQAAHELDVIHRDLKPDNVFVTHRENLVKVLDFGIAKIMGDRHDGSGHVTAAGTIVGTPLYMSPEAATASAQIGAATDYYSLGCMLFEMLVGQPPFDEKEPVLLLGLHIRARPPLLREVAADLDVPPALEALVDRLLSKNPSERASSAAALVAELEAIGAELFAQTASERESTQRVALATPALTAPTPRSAPWKQLGLGLLAATLLVGIGVAALRASPDDADTAALPDVAEVPGVVLSAHAASPDAEAPAAVAASPRDDAPAPDAALVDTATTPDAGTPSSGTAAPSSGTAAPVARRTRGEHHRHERPASDRPEGAAPPAAEPGSAAFAPVAIE